MKRRLVIGAAIVLVIGLAVVGVTVGVNVSNGTYGQASTLIGSELKANGAVSREAERLRKLSGVAKVAQAFAPLHLPNPTATLTVTMTSDASSEDIIAVSRSVSASSRDAMAAGLLTLVVKEKTMSIRLSKFDATTSALSQQLAVWDALRLHTSVAIVGHITDTPSESSQALTITTASGTPEAARSLAGSYVAAFRSSVGFAAGTSWKLPGMSGADSLPPTPILALFAASAERLPVAEHDANRFTSGVSLRWNLGSQPFARFSLAYVTKAHPFAPTAAHISEASYLAQAVVASGLPGVNFAYEAFNEGAEVQYDFYTGVCHGRALPTYEKSDDLSALGLTVDQLNGGRPGQCLPPA